MSLSAHVVINYMNEKIQLPLTQYLDYLFKIVLQGKQYKYVFLSVIKT